MSDLWKALAATAFPIVALSVIGTAILVESVFFDLAWLGAAALLIIAFVAAIVFTVKGEKRIAAGIWLAIGIGFVSLMASCVANVNEYWPW